MAFSVVAVLFPPMMYVPPFNACGKAAVLMKSGVTVGWEFVGSLVLAACAVTTGAIWVTISSIVATPEMAPWQRGPVRQVALIARTVMVANSPGASDKLLLLKFGLLKFGLLKFGLLKFGLVTTDWTFVVCSCVSVQFCATGV